MKIEENNTSPPIPQAVLASFFGYRQFFLFTVIITFLRRISLGPEGMGRRDVGMMYF